MIILLCIAAIVFVGVIIVAGIAIMGGPSSRHASTGSSEDSGEE